MPYLYSKKITTKDNNEKEIESLYNEGFVFTRLGKGAMSQIRSLRVNLGKTQLSSENKRVLKRTESITCSLETLPFRSYHWTIGKMASDFYSTKFGEGTMSANKIKEMFTDPEKSNMNSVFTYQTRDMVVGYCLAYKSKNIIHYSYPFYSLTTNHHLLGITMMTKAVLLSKAQNIQFIYLGSAHDQKSLYKLQFKGLEWWDSDTNEWQSDVEQLKKLVKG